MKVAVKFLAIGVIGFAFFGCLRETPQIRVIAERTTPDEYSFRWEVLPPISGTVKIYVSSDPEQFDLSQPCAEVPIIDGAASFPAKKRSERYFFLLKFNNRYQKIVANRAVCSDYIRNLRDIGGYQSKDEKTIKWAKIYRSGNIKVPMGDKAACLTSQMKAKTIIGFYSKKGDVYAPGNSQLENIHYINTYIPDPIVPEVIDLVLEGKMKKGDAILYMQEQYLNMYENADLYFNPMFNVLLNAENYPVLLTDERGVDRVGFAVGLLMAALEIPGETITEDYMLSKNQTDLRLYIPRGKSPLFLEQQETIALLLNPHEKAFSLIRSRIESDFGSIDNYLEKKLKLDKAKRKKLKQLLLY